MLLISLDCLLVILQKFQARVGETKDTAKGIVVRHLGKSVKITEFFTDEVFTPEYLKEIDDKILKPAFQLPSSDSFEDVKDIEDLITIGNEDE